MRARAQTSAAPRGLTDTQHRQAEIAQYVALSLAVTKLARNRQGRLERRDGAGRVALAELRHAEVSQRRRLDRAIITLACRGESFLRLFTRHA